MSDYAEDRFHRKLDAALVRAGERDEVGIGAWANHDDPRDEWPNASDWTVSGIAGMLADANDDFWTAYHRVCAERGDDAADALGDQYEAMARRLLTTPALADWLAQRIEQAKAEAEREVLDRLGEAAGQYHDVLDREIADSLRRDREYVEAHDRAVKAEERERIASAIIARNVLHHGKDRRDDCLCLCCSSFRDAARIAREVPHA